MIELQSIDKAFLASDGRRIEALKSVDLQVPQGHIHGVIGRSGAGKSTLLRCINLLEMPEEGEISVAGERVKLDHKSKHKAKGTDSKQIDRLRTHLGMVFQNFNLFPHVSVLENIMLAPTKILKRSRSEVELEALALLEKVGLPDKRNAYPRQLSGGQQQRIAIARALAMKPKLMLFDEPTSALDPEMISEVLDVMVDLSKAGMTMIVVTHEMGFARAAADRVILMHNASIVEDAAPQEFFENPKSEHTQLFLSKILQH